MNFALNELHVTILNLLLVGLLAIFLGLALEDVYKFHLASDIVPPASETVGAPAMRQRIVRRPRVLYDAITQRDIFNLAPAPEAPVEREDLQIRLLGTSLLTSGRPFVIVEDQSGRQSLYRKGDEIPGAGRLLEIEQNRAIVLHNGRRVALEIPRENRGPASPPRQRRRSPYPGNPGMRRPMPLARPVPGPGVQRLAPNRYVLARSAVDADLRNPTALFTQIRAIPDVKEGAPRGFRLSEIQPGSVFEQIGLQDGDLLTAVSGQPMGDPVKAISMLQTLRDRSSITLNVIRDGTPVQLYYSIR